MLEKYQFVISEVVTQELLQKGHNLIAQMPSERFPGRRIYVFANNERMERDITMYDDSTYYA